MWNVKNTEYLGWKMIKTTYPQHSSSGWIVCLTRRTDWLFQLYKRPQTVVVSTQSSVYQRKETTMSLYPSTYITSQVSLMLKEPAGERESRCRNGGDKVPQGNKKPLRWERSGEILPPQSSNYIPLTTSSAWLLALNQTWSNTRVK